MSSSQLPVVTRLPASAESRPFNSAAAAAVPLDLAAYGYLEEEFTVAGTAAIYADDLRVEREVPYVNRVVVRRPANAELSSGVVLLEILNASNGYPAEGLWRRAWDHLIGHRHTYVGVVSKPIDIDALKIFDPVRYASLSWDLDPAKGREPVCEVAGGALGAIIEGAEEGLVWDVITDLGRLLREDASSVVGDGGAVRTLILGGQSQSGAVLNTWLRHFHPRERRSDGRALFDGYLVSVASVVERPLRQQPSPDGLFATTAPADGADVDIPLVSVFAEGDVALWAGHGQHHVARPGLGDGEWRRMWCVPGASHTELFTPAMPGAADVRAAARSPRRTTPEAAATGNPFPFEAFVTGAFDAVLRWITDGTPAAESRYFALDDSGGLARDDYGNVLGGVRAGIVAAPVATFVGGTGGTGGRLELHAREDVIARYPTAEDYLAAVSEVDAELQRAGYLGDSGRRALWLTAAQLYVRAVS